jgi:AraC family transcriptional activator of pyochelin receptor
MPQLEIKNTAETNYSEIPLDQGLSLYRFDDLELSNGFQFCKGDIYFVFNLNVPASFRFSAHYGRPLAAEQTLLFYNPEMDVPVSIHWEGVGRMLVIRTSISRLHNLFLEETPELAFLNRDNVSRKFYEERPTEPRLMVPLNQLLSQEIRSHAHKVLCKGKIYEILGLLFSGQPDSDREACPFLNDEDVLRKIKAAKDYILNNMQNPPTIRELAREVGINEFRLKTGFKEVYGNTIFGFLLDYKLEKSRVLLESGQYKINEVAFALGYTNPSHFISAFKKKYGITPKKYTVN